MSTYGSSPVRVSRPPSEQLYARRRFGAGILLGVLAQLLLAVILGFILAGGLSLGVRVTATLLSSLVATPAVFTAGFAFMLKDRSRALGGGVVLGALVATILLVLAYLVS